MMSAATLREALAARPFVVHVADRRQFAVPRPEFASVGPRGRPLSLWHEDDGYSLLDMPTITGIDVPRAAT